MKVYVVNEYSTDEFSVTVKCVTKSFEHAKSVVEDTYAKWLADDDGAIIRDYAHCEVIGDYAYAYIETDSMYATVETVLMEVED